MPVDNIAFYGANPDEEVLKHFDETVVLRLDLRPTDTGKYVVFGRVSIENWDDDAQFASAKLTTLDGKTQLDRVDVRLSGHEDGSRQTLCLQAILELGNSKATPIVDLRCSSHMARAAQAKLVVISVDEVKNVVI